MQHAKNNYKNIMFKCILINGIIKYNMFFLCKYYKTFIQLKVKCSIVNMLLQFKQRKHCVISVNVVWK